VADRSLPSHEAEGRGPGWTVAQRTEYDRMGVEKLTQHYASWRPNP
jgi:hypothetical protein